MITFSSNEKVKRENNIEMNNVKNLALFNLFSVYNLIYYYFCMFLLSLLRS